MRRLTQARISEASPELAMIGYGLLFASVFFAGVPALIAVVMAYTQRTAAAPWVRTHYDFQIKVFWVGFACAFLAGICGLAGVIGSLGQVMGQASISLLEAGDSVRLNLSHVTLDRWVLAALIAAAVFGVAGFLWLLAAPVVGFLRLASTQAMRDLDRR